MNLLTTFTCILTFTPYIYAFDPISIGSAAVAIGAASFRFIRDNTYCMVKECCTEKEIPADYYRLQQSLEGKLFGQHIVKNVVLNAIKAHWVNNESHKPLSLSFHGWPGSGKNYVASFIKDSLYAKGSKSNHVHHFMGRITFPLDDHKEKYQENLYNWIKGNVTRCPKQLFIFDEVDKIPEGVLNVLKPLLDYNEYVENVDYRQSIFIFLSNTGSSLIVEEMKKFWLNGIPRTDIKLKDFEKLILKGAFNEKGGFHFSDTISSNLIDHYIPFLPMERQHVRLCIIEEFRTRLVNPDEDHIKEVLEFIEWGPDKEKLFSTTGCKRLSQKVAMIIQQYGLRDKS